MCMCMCMHTYKKSIMHKMGEESGFLLLKDIFFLLSIPLHIQHRLLFINSVSTICVHRYSSQNQQNFIRIYSLFLGVACRLGHSTHHVPRTWRRKHKFSSIWSEAVFQVCVGEQRNPIWISQTITSMRCNWVLEKEREKALQYMCGKF